MAVDKSGLAPTLRENKKERETEWVSQAVWDWKHRSGTQGDSQELRIKAAAEATSCEFDSRDQVSYTWKEFWYDE